MFNDKYWLTKAALSGRKTQTRRIIPKSFFSLMWDEREDTLAFEDDFGDWIDIQCSAFAKYKVGEVVAVAQAYKNCINDLLIAQGYKTDIAALVFKKSKGWTNKMFVRADLMPHRIRITDVRVERLQDISAEDCMAEGITYDQYDLEYDCGDMFDYPGNGGDAFDTPNEAYAALIDKISGKGAWERNPYVFVYDFELVK